MLIFPAIDLYEGKAVRLYKGDYEQMTVYSDSPIELVEDFVEQGAKYLHLIDLEGAKTGQTPNLELIRDIRALSPLFTQVGGGSRSVDVIDAFGFCRRMQELGVKTLICTDISRDGAMQGTNRNLYRTLSRRHDMNIIASGGISTIDDIRALRDMELHGAVIGRPYYTKAIDLREAIEVAK